MERKRTLRNGERIDDRWAATLSYFPSSANLEIDLSLDEGKCEGAARIKIQDRKKAYRVTRWLHGGRQSSRLLGRDASDSISHRSLHQALAWAIRLQAQLSGPVAS
jgi:hypothetical protein